MSSRTLQLPWGGGSLSVTLPEKWQVQGILEPSSIPPCADPQAEVLHALADPIGAPQIRNLVRVGMKVAIVIDDGIATGATTRAALRAMRARKPKKLVLAVPVAPTDTLEAMEGEADEIVSLEQHIFFGAIGIYYSDFQQISDEEVIAILKRFPPEGAKPEAAA